jgi:hypothetical protein
VEEARNRVGWVEQDARPTVGFGGPRILLDPPCKILTSVRFTPNDYWEPTMFYRTLAALGIFFVVTSVSLAAEYKATIKKVNADKSTIVVTIDDKEQTFLVARDAEIYTQAKGKKNKPGPKNPIEGGLVKVKEGSEVTLTTIKSGETEIVSSIKVEMGRRKKNK